MACGVCVAGEAVRVVEHLEPVGGGGRHAAVDLVGADMRRVDVFWYTAARDHRPANTQASPTAPSHNRRLFYSASLLAAISKKLGSTVGRGIGRAPIPPRSLGEQSTDRKRI